MVLKERIFFAVIEATERLEEVLNNWELEDELEEELREVFLLLHQAELLCRGQVSPAKEKRLSV